MNNIAFSMSPDPIDTIVKPPLQWSDITVLFDTMGQWVSDHSVEILIAIAAGFAIYLLQAMIANRAAKFAHTRPNRYSLTAITARAIARTGHFFMLMLAIRLVSGFANVPETAEWIINFLFIIAIAYQIAIWSRELVLGMFERRALVGEAEGSETLANAMTLIRLLVTFILFAIATIVVLDNLGVDVTGLVAGLGVGGIAIGLAAQGIFSDLFAALSIIFDKPFKRGDSIAFEGFAGSVEKIGLKSTRIRSLTGEEVIISNTNLLGKEITNNTQLERRRTRFHIGIIYQTEPDKARRIPDILQQVVVANDAVFVRAGFVGFGDSSINFELDFDIMSPDYAVMFEGRHRIGLAVLQKFNELGYEFAYPTQTTFTSAPDGTMIMPYPEGGYGAIPGKD